MTELVKMCLKFDSLAFISVASSQNLVISKCVVYQYCTKSSHYDSTLRNLKMSTEQMHFTN